MLSLQHPSAHLAVGCTVSLDCSGLPVSTSSLSKPNFSSDVQIKEPPRQKQTEANTTLCDRMSCWRSESCGLGQRGPGWAWWFWWLWWSPQLCWNVSGEPHRASQPQKHHHNIPEKMSSLKSHLHEVIRVRSAPKRTHNLQYLLALARRAFLNANSASSEENGEHYGLMLKLWMFSCLSFFMQS